MVTFLNTQNMTLWMNEQGWEDPILEGCNPPGSSDLAGKHLLQLACIGDRGFLEGQKTRMDSGPRGLGSDSAAIVGVSTRGEGKAH